VLVAHWTGSVGEAIAIGFDGMKRATVVGTPMAGLRGSVDEYVLPNAGVRVKFQAERLFHVNGTPREAYIPKVRVAPLERPGTDQDAILEAGLRLLKNLLDRFPSRWEDHD
jgi:carboxyl-terminal processing protease